MGSKGDNSVNCGDEEGQTTGQGTVLTQRCRGLGVGQRWGQWGCEGIGSYGD